MATKRKKSSIDFAVYQQKIKAQFTGLDPNDPSLWPDLPRNLLLLAAAVVTVVALWYVWLSGFKEQLVAETAREQTLRTEYTNKLGQAINLDALRQQLEQVQQYVTQLEKQLPSKAEMDALLSDINQAGLGRSLQFELFRPGQVNVQEYYAELPIALRVTGTYHDIGLFAGDVANLSRIVTLNDMRIAPVANRAGTLTLDATAKTFRYLDLEEVAAQQAAARPAQGARQ
ncbi:MAG: type 4a pilus biogenesis protein PilO [Serpentinimonas sp.]|nr:type 4a pilus biogenesis protein PilO [Serpentinimonas sp.]